MAICEICWEKAGTVAKETVLTQYEAYMQILSNERDVHELEDEIAILRDALKKYADRDRWAYDRNWCGEEDRGYTIAQEALLKTVK